MGGGGDQYDVRTNHAYANMTNGICPNIQHNTPINYIPLPLLVLTSY
jgi:hypothetical protein